MQYNFEWDTSKARTNLLKHKINFERAAEIFLDPLAVSIYDNAQSLQEERWITMGKDRTGKVLLVIHTFLEQQKNLCLIRIISARKATKNEMKQYEGKSL
jgi:uncharacterized DUF497 family protein